MPLYIIYVLIWFAGFSINFPEIYWWNISSFEISRSSHPEVFFRKAVLKICSKFTEENPCRSVISITLLENTFRHGCSPVNLLHISRTPFPRNTSGWLLLNILWRKDLSNSSISEKNRAFKICILKKSKINALSTNPAKCSNTLKQFVRSCW